MDQHQHHIDLVDCPTCRERDLDNAAFERQFVQDQITWPGGARCVATLFIDFQGSEGLEPVKNGLVDYEEYMTREYGPRTGVWRLLRILKSQGLKATFAVTGAIAKNFPETIAAIQEDGHEIAGHGYHHEWASRLSREEEHEALRATIAQLEDLTGERITGWRNCHESRNTRDLVIEHGLKWNSNSFLYDFPFLLHKDGKTLVEVPRHTHGDLRHEAPSDFSSIWKKSFEMFYWESQFHPTFAPVTLHPFSSGRPWGGRAVQELLTYIQEHDGVTCLTVNEIADLVLQAAQTPVAVSA